MKLSKSKLKEIIKEELQQLNEIETWEYNQQVLHSENFPKIFFDQFKRMNQNDYMKLLDSREFTKIVQKYMKLNKQLAAKFGNDIKKIKK